MSALARQIQRLGLEQVRFAWCDLHGQTRAKALSVGAAVQALRKGVGMVGTLALKDSSDRTAFAVFDPEFAARHPALAGAANMLLKPIESTFKVLPWAPRTGWIQCEACYAMARPWNSTPGANCGGPCSSLRRSAWAWPAAWRSNFMCTAWCIPKGKMRSTRTPRSGPGRPRLCTCSTAATTCCQKPAWTSVMPCWPSFGVARRRSICP
jgi:hypothetical protein